MKWQVKMKGHKIILTGMILFIGILLSACTQQPVFVSPSQPSKEASMSSSPTTMNHTTTIKDEKDFINQMIPHHQEAIDTSKIVLAQTADPELQKFAQDVIRAQTAEIDQMKLWLKDWYQENYQVNSSYTAMMEDLTILKGEELESAYIRGMVTHHQGAIGMAEQVLVLNPRPEVEKMADEIIAVQSEEVSILQGWLSSKYGEESSIHTTEHK